MIKDIYNQVIDDIRDTNPMEILIVGSSKDGLAMNKDIDLFVIYDGDMDFQREIRKISGVEFDINYLGLDNLRGLIKDKKLFILRALSDNRALMLNKCIIDLANMSREILKQGPESMSEDEIKYIRYSFAMKLGDIKSRLGEAIASSILMPQAFYGILVEYFRLNRIWVPKDKKLLKEIASVDEKLYQLCKEYIDEIDELKRYNILRAIIEYVLMDFGGLKSSWEKGSFPTI